MAKGAPVQCDTTSDLNVELEAVDTDAFWARFGAELKRRADDGEVEDEDEDASHTITEDFSTRGEGSPCISGPQPREEEVAPTSTERPAQDYLPNTQLFSERRNVTQRQTYAGLKTMPPGSYERFKVMNPADSHLQTYFVCNFHNCQKVFQKSTSLIVHYWRHNNVRPFTCNLCNKSFTQSGTLSRHNRAVHKIKSTVSLTWEQVAAARQTNGPSGVEPGFKLEQDDELEVSTV